MKLAFTNPTTTLTVAPESKDIIFDLTHKAIYARGVKFDGTNYSVFKKHTSNNLGGYVGLVPVPSYTNTTTRFLREDGTWENIVDNYFTSRGDWMNSNVDADNLIKNGIYLNATGNGSNNSNFPSNYGHLITFKHNSSTEYGYSQIHLSNNDLVYHRIYWGGVWSSWKELQHKIDINNKLPYSYLSGTPTSLPASKLEKSVTIWGQTFDGTNNITGDITLYTASGDSPALIFQRKTIGGEDHVDWRTYVSRGFLKFQFADSNVNSGAWTDMVCFKEGGIMPEITNTYNLGNSDLKWSSVYATSFIGNLDGQYVNKLTNYSKSTTVSAIVSTDTLNSALGKLEYKADLGKTAYDWYQSVTATDNDEYINKWGEIVGFLDSVKEGTDILDEFVTRKTALTITGLKRFVTNTNEQPLIICRNSGNSEALKIGVNDSGAIFDYDNDEKSCSFVFKMVNTDVEGSDGSGANASQVIFNGSASGSTIIANTLQGSLAYSYLTGSGTTANQAIVSTGTTNKWTLKTLGDNAFSSIAYLPLTGGTLTGDLILNNPNPDADSPKLIFNRNGSNSTYYDWQQYASAGDLIFTCNNTGSHLERIRFTGGGGILIAGKEVLHSGNYSSYSPTLSSFNTLQTTVNTHSKNISDIISGEQSVGLADDLGGCQETTPEEFIYQPTAGEYTSIKDGMASIKSLKGNSLVWNQKLDIASITSSHSQSYANREAILTELSASSISIWNTVTKATIELIKGHKYLTMFKAKSNIDGCKMSLFMGFSESYATGSNYLFNSFTLSTAYRPIGFITDWNTQTTSRVTPLVSIQYRKQMSGFDNDIVSYNIKDHVIIDLTQMFGEGNEPTTIEEFEARKPKVGDEYAYNEGQVIHFNGEAIKSVGFNQFDGQLEQGRIDAVGGNQAQAIMVRSKNYIPVISGAKYYFNVSRVNNDTVYVYPYYYDKDKKYISDTFFPNYAPGREQTIPSNAAFLRFFLYQDGFALKPSDFTDKICINLSHTGIRNGEYEPYTEHTLYLPSAAQDMKSAGTAYDEIYFDEAKKKYFKVQRMGEVDLGDLNWIDYTQYDYGFAVNVSSFMKTENLNYILSKDYKKYTNPSIAEWQSLDKAISNGIRAIDSAMWTKLLVIKDSSYTDAVTFKAAMQGVMLYYELAEPIITEITDYEGYMDYPVSDFGTEEVLSLRNTAPIKADIEYGFNAVDTIRNNRLDISDILNGDKSVKKADSLSTVRTIWGLNFDGTNNVSGNLLLGNASIFGSDNKLALSLRGNNLYIGEGYNSDGFITNITGDKVKVLEFGEFYKGAFLVNGNIQQQPGTGHSTVLSGHIYRNLYTESSPVVYDHYYYGTPTQTTYAELRVWDATKNTFKAFCFGGNGRLIWDGNNVIHGGNIQNNLTSTETKLALSAYQGYLLANGSARDNTKLPLSGGAINGNLTVSGLFNANALTLNINQVSYDKYLINSCSCVNKILSNSYIIKTGINLTSGRKYYFEIKGDLYSANSTINVVVSFYMYNSSVYYFRVSGTNTHNDYYEVVSYLEENVNKVGLLIRSTSANSNIQQHFITVNSFKNTSDPNPIIEGILDSDIETLTVLKSIYISSPSYFGSIVSSGNISTTAGFVKTNSSNNYILLGGGGEKPISDFLLKSEVANQELTNNLTTISKSITLTKDWQDTGISINPTTFTNGSGTYAVLVYVSDGDQGFLASYFSGIMSVYVSATNSSVPDDEILLHHSAHACSHLIYLKTKPVTGSTDYNKLYIACNKDMSVAINITFKFKKLI